MNRFFALAIFALLPLAGCGDDGFLHGSAPVEVTDTSSAIKAEGRFRCFSGGVIADDEPSTVVHVDGRLANTSGQRASFVAILTILNHDQRIRVQREWVMPARFISYFLQFESRDQALSGRESLQAVDPNIERCDLTIR